MKDADSKGRRKNNSVVVEVLATIFNPETLQTYVLGTKKSGKPRAIYDVYRDHTKPKKKKKQNKADRYSLYFGTTKKNKKGKKNKKSKYWQYGD